MLAVDLAQAEEAKRQLLIYYVSNSPPCESLIGTNSVPVQYGAVTTYDDDAVRRVPAPHNQLTSGDRWEKFETDFGVLVKDPSLIKGSLETCKYQLDRTLFGMQEIVQDVQRAVSFDCELRNMGRDSYPVSHSGSSQVPIPLWDTLERARFQSDIDLNMLGARAFLGVRLVLPIGN